MKTKNLIVTLILALSFVCWGKAHAFSPFLIPSQLSNGTQVDTGEIGDRTPLILIHGMRSSSDIWDDFLIHWRNDPVLPLKTKPYSFRYFDSATIASKSTDIPQNISQLGGALKGELEKSYDRQTLAPFYGFNNQHVIILAHSMGGLVARSMMQEHRFVDGNERGGQKVLRLITLATPHHGSPIADIPSTLASPVLNVYKGFLEDLRWDSYDGATYGDCNNWLRKLNSYDPDLIFDWVFCANENINIDGFYSKILAYGANVNEYAYPYGVTEFWLSVFYDSLSVLGFENDGIVPLQSSLFDRSLFTQARQVDISCDHSMIYRGICTVGGTAIFDVITNDIIDAIPLLPSPVITTVSPDKLSGLPLPQTQPITISGYNFQPTSTLTFSDGNTIYANINPEYSSTTELSYDITVGNTSTVWTVNVVNGTVESNSYPFNVVATSTTPDTTAPEAPVSLSVAPGNWSKNSLYYLDWNNPSDPSGLVKVWWKLGSAPTSPTDGLAFDLPLFKPLPISSWFEGADTVHVWLEDGAGNKDHNNRSTTTLYYDKTSPAITITEPTTNTSYNSTIGSITLSGTASDSLSGISNIYWSDDKGGSGTITADEYWISPVIGLSNGDNIITVVVIDAAGNSTLDTITVTYTPPASTTHTLDVTASNGDVIKSPDSPSYSWGSQVTLTPAPFEGYTFSGWSGDIGGMNNPLILIMDSNKNITANFVAISSETGSVRVSIVPQGAADAGAQWKLTTESTWHDSGTIKYNVPFGTHQIEFKTIYGWATPTNREVTLSTVVFDIWIDSDSYVQQYINAPSNLQAVKTADGEITITWDDNSSNEEAFIIERIEKTSEYSTSANLGPDTTSWVDDGFGSGLPQGTTYCYRVKAWASAFGNSYLSNDFCVSLYAGILLVSPTTGGFNFSGGEEGPYSPSSSTITVQNTGNSSLDWAATSALSWLNTDTTFGSIAPNSSTLINVSINTTDADLLVPGVFNDTITISASGAVNSPQSVPVSLTIYPAGTEWSIETIDSVGWVGRSTSLAIDSNDKVHITYEEEETQSPFYTHLKYATNVSGSWVANVIDNSSHTGYLNSIAIDSADHVHISYRHYDSLTQISHLKYMTNESGSWATYTIDNSGTAGAYNSIAIDKNNKVHISYTDTPDSGTTNLKYATNISGSWVTIIIDSSGTAGKFTSIAVGSNNDVHISYIDAQNQDLKYATNIAGSWAVSTIDSNYVGISDPTSIAIDSSDKAHISYFGMSYDGSSWNYEQRFTTNVSGTWYIYVVDDSGNNGGPSAVALDSVNKAHISYYDGINNNLKYATNESDSWVTSTIDSAGYVGWYSSIGIDSNNTLHISYYDHVNRDLKYAKKNASVITPSPEDDGSASSENGGGSVGWFGFFVLVFWCVVILARFIPLEPHSESFNVQPDSKRKWLG